MFQIRYEYFSESYPRFDVYKIQDQNQILQYNLHENFRSILKESNNYPKYNHFFMLDENNFSFFRFDIFQIYENTFTFQDLKKIIEEKAEETKKQNDIDGERIMAYIDTIYVDGEEKNFVVGEKGEFFFRLYIVYVIKKTLNVINSVYGNFFETKNLTLVPQSFNTLLFLRNNLKKDNFVLLYITETYCKAIKVQQGFYASIEILNLGIGALKQMYKDNGIVQYRYKSYEFIEVNPLAKSLVMETLEFYSQLFCKWLYEKNLVGNDVIVISSITKNVHFIDAFNSEYKKITNNYIVPFHHSDHLQTFDRKRDPEHMDVLVLLNREESIRKTMITEDGNRITED